MFNRNCKDKNCCFKKINWIILTQITKILKSLLKFRISQLRVFNQQALKILKLAAQ